MADSDYVYCVNQKTEHWFDYDTPNCVVTN